MDEDESRRQQARSRVLNSLVVGVLRALAEASQRPVEAEQVRPTDVALGLGAVARDGTRRVTEVVGLAVRPLAGILAPPAAVRERPARLLRDLAERGRAEREAAALRMDAMARRFAPRLLDTALDYVDLTDVVRDHVDVDAIIATVDLDAAVARVDIASILDRVDVDAIAAKLDLEAVLDRVDVDAIAAKLDLEAVVDRVDVDAVAAKLDLDAVVGRLDLIALAEAVAEGIDLPGIIASSSGSMASEAMREVRWQGIGADERVAAVVDRMLRRPQREPGTPRPQAGPPGGPPAGGQPPAEGTTASGSATGAAPTTPSEQTGEDTGPGPSAPPGRVGMAH